MGSSRGNIADFMHNGCFSARRVFLAQPDTTRIVDTAIVACSLNPSIATLQSLTLEHSVSMLPQMIFVAVVSLRALVTRSGALIFRVTCVPLGHRLVRSFCLFLGTSSASEIGRMVDVLPPFRACRPSADMSSSGAKWKYPAFPWRKRFPPYSLAAAR